MEPPTAALLLQVLGGYAVLGAGFALPFIAFGGPRLDSAARGASTGFRLAILPGVVTLWPWLGWLWWREHRAARSGA